MKGIGTRARFVLGAVVLVLTTNVLAAHLAAQETRGKISGTVRDSGGVIPGASVKITNTDTGVSQNLTTNESGYFEASFLNPGTYTVSVQMPGYKAAMRDHIALGVGDQLTVPFTLEVGQISEQIDVTAETPVLDTTLPSTGFTRSSCDAVPGGFYQVSPSRSPVLLLSGGIDPVTPPRHGERVAKALGPLARHVVVANAGHGVMAIGCMRDVIFRFVDAVADADALAVDAGCAAKVPRPPAFVSLRAAHAKASEPGR